MKKAAQLKALHSRTKPNALLETKVAHARTHTKTRTHGYTHARTHENTHTHTVFSLLNSNASVDYKYLCKFVERIKC